MIMYSKTPRVSLEYYNNRECNVKLTTVMGHPDTFDVCACVALYCITCMSMGASDCQMRIRIISTLSVHPR